MALGQLSRKVIFLWLSILCVVLMFFFHAWSIEAPEYQIKAVYLYNFCKFTEWPTTTPQPLFVCVVGNDPFKGSFDRLVAGKSIKNRPLKVRHLENLRELDRCDVYYLSGTSAKSMVDETLRSALAKGALSIGDTPDFIEQGGQVRLYKESGKIIFDVNLAALEKAGLKIDARVLNLAKRVRR